MFKCRICYTPFKYLFCSIDKLGIQFWHKGDEVIWVFPWKRKNNKNKFISISFTGTGEFGDATFESLSELDKYWFEFEKCCEDTNRI